MSKSMENDLILKSIADIIAGIDLKLEQLLNREDNTQTERINEAKMHFEQLAKNISALTIGDLANAVLVLERKIDLFDHDIKDSLRSFSDVLINYEKKLEERIIREIQILQEEFIKKMELHQTEQIEKFEKIYDVINNLGIAVAKLDHSVNNFNSKQFYPALNRLEEILSHHLNPETKKHGFFQRIGNIKKKTK